MFKLLRKKEKPKHSIIMDNTVNAMHLTVVWMIFPLSCQILLTLWGKFVSFIKATYRKSDC